MEPDATSSDHPDVAAFARTFAPDRNRRPLRRTDHLWLGGFGLLTAAVLLVVVAWFAYQRALPATGPFQMKPSPGLSIEQRRTINHDAAPWMAVASLPLLASGVWLVVRRPSERETRAVAIAGAVLFAVVLAVASSTVEGRVGIGF